MEPFDLRTEPWLPVRRKDGTLEWIAPNKITEGVGGANPIVALACPRTDFSAAVTEFLIGILTASLEPAKEADWKALYVTPPDPDALAAALAKLPNAFSLFGSDSRIFQDKDEDAFSETEPTPIEQLLIEAPGDQTTRLNKDLFVKRDRVHALGRPAAAMAVITMQTYAPSGGQGHRTSMRGGGPLTTLAEPRENPDAEPFWRLLWANAETRQQRLAGQRSPLQDRGARPDDIYPWMAETRVSDPKRGGTTTTPQDADPLQTYFGLPRRIRLDVSEEAGLCDLTGQPDTHLVPSFRMRNFGTNYEAWVHPLSPHVRNEKTGLTLPVHGQAGGIAWRDWAGFLFRKAESGGLVPANCIAQFASRRAPALGLKRFRISALGYDMDNMKARGWVQSEMPGYPETLAGAMAELAEACANATDLVASLLQGAVNRSLYADPANTPRAFLADIKLALWHATEADFFALMDAAAAGTSGPQSREAFRQTVRRQALAIFDRYCPADSPESAAFRRLITERFRLQSSLNGHGPKGKKLFSYLGIPELQRDRKSA